MKKYSILIILLVGILCNSCAVVSSVLGDDECNYPNCDRRRADNCAYCIIHCQKEYLPEDFNKKAGKAIDEQIKPYKPGKQ